MGAGPRDVDWATAKGIRPRLRRAVNFILKEVIVGDAGWVNGRADEVGKEDDYETDIYKNPGALHQEIRGYIRHTR